MREVLRFEPAYTTAETFDSFVRLHQLGRVLPVDAVRLVERELLGVAGRVSGGSP